VIPWSPLARGRLTRPWGITTERTENDALGQRLYVEADQQVVDRVGEAAEKLSVSRAQVALAWVLRNPLVAAPIVGATKRQHLDDAVAAVDLHIDAELLDSL
jgi:1-deoxyxylulose-5-phosphate synthase